MMTKIKIARKLSVFVCMFLSIKMFAQTNSPISINVSADVGIMNGKIQEFVFYSNIDKVLSRLDWDIKNIPVCIHLSSGLMYIPSVVMNL